MSNIPKFIENIAGFVNNIIDSFKGRKKRKIEKKVDKAVKSGNTKSVRKLLSDIKKKRERRRNSS